MAGLCVRSIFTVWKMSTTPSYLIRSKTMLRVIKTPVLPTPALMDEQRKGIHVVICHLAFHMVNKNTAQCVRMLLDHSPTMDWDGTILAELLFCFMYLANEINETLSWFWHSLFGPVSELKLPDCPWLSILRQEEEKVIFMAGHVRPLTKHFPNCSKVFVLNSRNYIWSRNVHTCY